MTASLSKFLSPNVENVTKIIDFTAAQGFTFIELRDTANLSLSNCTDIAAYAKKKNIEVIYSVGTGALEKGYLDSLPKWIDNAKAFGSPPFVRTGSGGAAFTANDTAKVNWTADDFNNLVQTLNKAGDTAKAAGLLLLVENAAEKLQGDGTTTFGTTELFGTKGVNSTVGLQVDTGNFFCVSRAPAKPEDVKTFFDKAVTRLGYVHVKTSKDNKAQPVMGESQLSLDYFFDTCSKNGKVYMAFELDSAAAKTLEEMYDNYIKSAEYLQKNF